MTEENTTTILLSGADGHNDEETVKLANTRVPPFWWLLLNVCAWQSKDVWVEGDRQSWQRYMYTYVTSILRGLWAISPIFLIVFLAVEIHMQIYPFRTEPNIGDEIHYGCSTIADDWQYMTESYREFSRFSIACRSIYFRSQICQDIHSQLYTTTPLPSVAMVSDPTVVCVPHAYDLSTTSSHVPSWTTTEEGKFIVSGITDAPASDSWIPYYDLPGDIKISSDARTRHGGSWEKSRIEVPTKVFTLTRSSVQGPARSRYTILFQEHEWDPLHSEKNPWRYYEEWSDPRGGTAVYVCFYVVLCLSMLQSFVHLIEACVVQHHSLFLEFQLSQAGYAILLFVWIWGNRAIIIPQPYCYVSLVVLNLVSEHSRYVLLEPRWRTYWYAMSSKLH